MGAVVVVSSDQSASKKLSLLLSASGWCGQVTHPSGMVTPDLLMEDARGLFLGDGPRLVIASYKEGYLPSLSSCSTPAFEQDLYQVSLIHRALEQDLPILGIGRGMQLLNLAFGGTLAQNIPGHCKQNVESCRAFDKHSIYLTPGSKLAAILGTGGFFRVNSHHVDGIKESQRSPCLLTSAYSLEDGVVEGLESPSRSWVLGVQWRPDRQDEVPAVFSRLFVSFVERAQENDAPT